MQFLNKKGSILDIIIWISIAFITVVFLGIWLYGHNLLTTALLNSGSDLVVNATQAIVVPVNDALSQWLQIIAFVIIFGMAISILISNFLIRAHPVFFVIHLFMTIVGIIVSATISNRYMELLTNPTIGTTLQSFTAVNFIMQWLPYFTAIIGIFGAIFLFMGIIRGREEGPNLGIGT